MDIPCAPLKTIKINTWKNYYCLLFFLLAFYHILENMSIFILSPFNNPRIKLIIVMVVIPMIFNAIELCLVDLIIQRKTEDTSLNNKKEKTSESESTTDDVNENISFIKDCKSSNKWFNCNLLF